MSGLDIEDDKKTERRRTAKALTASIVIHVVLILLVAMFFTYRAATITLPLTMTEEEPPVELTIIDLPQATPTPKPAYIATTESQQAPGPTENAPFESDRDTRAAAPMPAQGDAPVPTQEGENVPTLEMENKDYTAGPQARPSTPSRPSTPQPAIPPTAQPTEPQPTPEPTPQSTPEATPQPTPEATPQPTPEATPQPTPEATPEATPDSTPSLQPRKTTQLALLEPPKPSTSPRPRPQETQPDQQSQQQQPPSQPRPPSPSSPPGYQPQTRITRLRGNISNRGRSAVDANATPLGRYKKQLSDAIGSRWYYYVNDRMGLLSSGTVEIRFVVTSTGKVEKVQVLRNSSNESFASCSVQAIMEAEIPEIPKEIVPMLDNNRIEIDYSFTILSN